MDKTKIKSTIKAITKLVFVTLLGCLFFIGTYYILKYTGWLGKFSNMQELKNIILSAGFWSYCVFVVLQFLQVTILPLPAMLTTIVGVVIFGPFITFVLSTLAILAGSIFAFFLGKLFGVKLLFWSIGKEKTYLFQEKLKKGKFIFFIMMLFPFFPDDILCMLAGVINMDFKFFFFTNLITRPLGLFTICFIGTGTIIPFHSWGIIIWLLIAVVLIILISIVFKKKDKIEAMFLKNSKP